MKNLFLGISLFISFSSLACTDGTGFLPENDLFIAADSPLAGGLSEEEFNAVIDKTEAVYAPIISSEGGKLVVTRNWTDGTVNASAQRVGTWIVNMYGGLARHPLVTPDGFNLVLCHEIGHHIGGFPKNKLLGFNTWSSNEGQSDYFGSLKCLRKIFILENNEEILSKMDVPQKVKKDCAQSFSSKEEQLICQRSAMAGFSAASLLAALRKSPTPSFDLNDTNVVDKTFNAHPQAQCRLDTYYAGSLCAKDMNDDVSQKEETLGTCHKKLGDKVGLRPLCWFKPKN